MNKEGKNSNESVKSGINIKKWIPRLIVGGITLGVIMYSFKECKKSESSESDNSDADDIEDKKETKTDDNDNKVTGDQVIDKLLKLIYDDPIFGPEDLYINRSEDGDFDENNPSYVKVDYIEDRDDSYISVILKIEDTLYSKNRKKNFYDRDVTLKDLRDTIFEVKSKCEKYKGFKTRVEPLSFYSRSEGIPCELMDIKDMRELKSLTGFRYIEIKFLNTSDLGIKFVKDVLSELHPKGGEENSKFNITPFVINYDEGDIIQLKDNYVSSDYLDNGERYKK